MDKKGFKTRYEQDEYFRRFINESSALSHLPIEDINDGLKHIEDKFEFEDENGENFKNDFILGQQAPD